MTDSNAGAQDMRNISKEDLAALLRDKYSNDKSAVATLEFKDDLKRLASGEPLAYVIGWIPFLDLRINLETQRTTPAASKRPLIPRPETEWWTEKLIEHLSYKFEDRPFTLLDLCAGSGAIGLAVLYKLPNATVTFSDIEPNFESLIKKNLRENHLDEKRTHIYTGDLFEPLKDKQSFDVIATNPPYIPQTTQSELEKAVTEFEPHIALFSGTDGLDIIKKIIKDGQRRLNPDGELWIECDISNIGEAEYFARSIYADRVETSIQLDQYGRPRILILRF